MKRRIALLALLGLIVPSASSCADQGQIDDHKAKNQRIEERVKELENVISETQSHLKNTQTGVT